MNTIKIADCKVSRQLNGTTLFIVFEGSEQAITDAYNTLWNANAISGELEWLNAGQAVTTTTVKQFTKGLINRELLHLMNSQEACKTFKGKRFGFAEQAKTQAQTVWDSMADVRVITPMASIAPYFYKMQSSSKASEWQCERADANVD